MPNYNNFADRILTVRNHLKMNQEAFSQKLGVSQGYLAKVENGMNVFSRKVINRIANEFGISVAWLETGEGKAPFVQKKGSLLHRASIGGIWVMMIFNGAQIGMVAMSRLSLLIGRIQFLLTDWLGLVK